MKQSFKNTREALKDVSWLTVLSVLCVVILSILMNFGGAGLATVVILSLTAVVAAILSLREGR